MTPSRFDAIEEIFYSAMAQPQDQRDAFLTTACREDDVLRGEVEVLLSCYPRAREFIETPVVNLATTILESTPPELLTGRGIAHYELQERIGAGGMGEVYLAKDLVAGRKAALKLLPELFADEPERLRRFEQEARAVAALNHPNIVTVYEIGEDRGTHYIASELIVGETLRQRLKQGAVPLNEALEIGLQLASALSAAHEAGIIHRDIKPENIMLRPDGYVKVLDFGIAKLAEQELPPVTNANVPGSPLETQLGSIVGTLNYMSPEQVRSEAVTSSTDIWSIGAVLYEMLAGRPPFVGADAKEITNAIFATQPAPLVGLPVVIRLELQQTVDRTLRKGASERYASCHELVEALKDVRHRIDAEAARIHGLSKPIIVAVAGMAAAIALALYFYRQSPPQSPPRKSIAVLPFKSLSNDKEDAYFAVGFQDEILTDLARIADLKVVSRTSTSSYAAGQPRNSRRIGEELGVAHLLEGSVQRIAHRVRINAQLIDTRTDSHLWAQTYDRDVADIFAIQSEIAKAIAGQLQSRISQREKAAIAEPPTTDLIAHKLYLQAVSLESQPSDAEGLLKGTRLLEQAVTRDPRFLRAYCALARMHVLLYDVADHTPGRLEATKAAIEKAAQVEPDAGEVHLVRARYLSRALRDYDRARAELELARRTLPNDPALYFEGGLMDRRQARWAEALGNFDRAVELDPRNAAFLADAASTYALVRRYARATELYRRELAVAPQDNDCRLLLADISTSERADTRPFRAELNALAAKDPVAISQFADKFWDCAFLERDATAADRALAAMPPEGYRAYFGAVLPKEWYVGHTARLFNRPDVARQAFAAVCAILEKHLREAPDDGMSWSFLGRARAALNEKQHAIAAGQHACDVQPLSKEPAWGLEALLQLAKIYAAVGEKDLAIQQLSACAEQPSLADYGDLKLSPYWDPLRGDPRFEEIVGSLAPK